MTSRSQKAWAAAFACAFAVAAASGGTKTTAAKDQPPAPVTPPKKILVLAVADDPPTRAQLEDVIAGEISLRGGNAAAAHVTFPDLPKERAPFEAKLIAEGFDAVMVSRLIGSDVKIKMTEGYTTYATDYQGMDWWGGYWYTYQEVFVPGYLQKEKKVRVRTDLWRAVDGKGQLVWTGVSETMNPRTAAQAGREVGASIGNALAKKKLI